MKNFVKNISGNLFSPEGAKKIFTYFFSWRRGLNALFHGFNLTLMSINFGNLLLKYSGSYCQILQILKLHYTITLSLSDVNIFFFFDWE